MKALIRVFGKGYPMITIMLVTLFLVSCGGGGQKRQANEQLEETKEQTILNINKIKVDIEERIAYVNGELENATGETREELMNAKERLSEQKEVLNAELEKVRNASLDSWNDVVASASEAIAEGRRKTNEISKKVREMLDEQEE